MRRLLVPAALLAVALSTTLATLADSPRRTATPVSGVTGGAPTTLAGGDVLAKLPVSFEPVGDDRFVSRGPGYSLALSAADAVVAVQDGSFRLRPAGPTANPAPALVPGRPLAATLTRLNGDDPTRWTSGMAFATVEVRQVWPGVDMVWHGNQRRLEHDMVVAPGTDPAVVALDVEGARSLGIDPDGDLVVDLGTTTARLARPVVYQDAAGGRRAVDGAFALLGPARIGFRLGEYDAGLPLVIDPTLVTSTVLGGAGMDSGYAIAVDAEGNTYVTGATASPDFPIATPLQNASNANGDVFVSKLSPDGSRLIWSTYLGGAGRDIGYAIAVASDGSVYVAGVTESRDFPAARAAQAGFGGGASDGFVARIAATGAGLEWSSYIGGGGTDRARGVAVDTNGNAFVTGSTGSADFPSVNAQQPGPFRPDDLDAFLVKVAATGGPFGFATRLGGGNDDRGLAVALDAQGNPYVTGDTLSPGFPTVKPVQATLGGSTGGGAGSFADAFVTKYNSAGTALLYSTFLGGSDIDQGTAIAVDSQGAAYVAGNTNSPNFPTVAPLQATKGNEPDAFVSKLDPAGGALVYSTYIGGSGADGANGLAVDRAGSAYVVGTTGSPNWPSVKAIQQAKGGSDDAFLLRLDSTGRGPLFSSVLGGKEAESGMGVALDGQGGVHTLGLTSSSDFPSVKPVAGAKAPAGGDAFVATVSLADIAAPSTTASASTAAPASSTSPSSHDRRVRMLFLVTLALLAAAIIQTLILRRRTPATPPPRSRPKPAPVVEPGLKVLDDFGPKKSGASAKAPMPPRSARTPKARGGPKGAPAQKSGPARRPPPKPGQKAPVKPVTPPVAAEPLKAREPVDAVDDAGPPTEVAAGVDAAVAPTPQPRAKPQEPAIANLLEEDLWAPDPRQAAAPGAPPDRTDQPAPPPVAASAWAPFDTGSTPVVGDMPPGEPGPPIPPVPAEELSFWDLFPEDLPPARANPFPAEDLLADHLSLPEGPESAAGRLVGPAPGAAPEEPAPPARPAPLPEPAPVAFTPIDPDSLDGRPPPPPEAEIVIAELLDGPPPAGRRLSAESPWAPRAAEDDFLVDDLLADPPAPSVRISGADEAPANGDGPGDGDDLAPAAQGRSREEQARIAADRARRRRSRRGGRGKPPGPGS